ncbi:MAG: sigma-70 family RNA polymerase sigma factor [Bdellovibrio sp.]|nr:sigma-70 family RNA polymerase sigma factor [Methylotenera sp.]
MINSLVMEKAVLPTEQYFHVITGMLARDETSLVELYDCTLSKVYGLALKITRRHDLAEEVVEDTYMQAWQEIAKFDCARGPVMAWLMMICRSRAIDSLRRLDEAESHAEPELMRSNADVANNSPLDIMLLLERETDIHIAMHNLNALQRQLVALAFFKGYTHEEIALHMHMPLGTVKSNIKRAQNKLKDALNIAKPNNALPNNALNKAKGA